MRGASLSVLLFGVVPAVLAGFAHSGGDHEGGAVGGGLRNGAAQQAPPPRILQGHQQNNGFRCVIYLRECPVVSSCVYVCSASPSPLLIFVQGLGRERTQRHIIYDAAGAAADGL